MSTRRLGFSMLLLTVLYGSAWATTLKEVTATCPVCGTTNKGHTINSTNFCGGRDPDLLDHTRGAHHLVVTPMTCTKCSYSAESHDFGKPIPAALRAQLLKTKLSLPPERAIEDASWVKRALIAQIATLAGKRDRELGWLHLYTAWAVRIEENPFEGLLDELTSAQRQWISTIGPPDGKRFDPVKRDLELSRALLALLSKLPKDRRRAAAVVIGDGLRRHGEHAELLAALPSLKSAFDAKEWDDLEDWSRTAIAIERRYQRLAVESFVAALKKDRLKPAPRAELVYLVGEIHRRLGAADEARRYLRQALGMTGAKPWIKPQARQQLLLLPRR